MLGDLEDQSVLSTLNLESVQNWGSIAIELNVNDWTDDGGDSADHVALGGMSHRVADNRREHIAVPICKFDLRL